MIRFVQSQRDRERFSALCQGSAFGCRLAAAAHAYGFGLEFARFWYSGTAAYGLLDGVLSLAGRPEDVEEARAFLDFLRPGSVCGPAGVLRALELPPTEGGPVLAKSLPVGREERPPPAPEIPAIWRLLAGAGMALDREAFHLDLSHRLRHGAALALGQWKEGRLAGCAVVSLPPGREALLSALAVEEGFRGQGLGSELLRQTERCLPGRRLYLLREAGKNRAFYQNRGFRVQDRWRTARPGN